MNAGTAYSNIDMIHERSKNNELLASCGKTVKVGVTFSCKIQLQDPKVSSELTANDTSWINLESTD